MSEPTNAVADQTGREYFATNIKLTFKQRMEYSIAELGYNALYYWVSAFMMIFFTDTIGVAAAAVSTLTLVVRVFDGLNDPFIGSLADRTKSKWGRYKPWVAIGGIVMGILIVALFAANPNWSYTTKIVYMWVIYVCVTVASTCCNMPFGALNGVMTSDGEERAKLSSLRMTLANLGGNFTPVFATVLIVAIAGTNTGPQAAKGYLGAVAITAVFSIPLLVYAAVKVKEVVKPPPNQNKIPLKSQFAAFFQNKYALLVAGGFFLIGFAAYGRMAMLTYYFTYVANNLGYMSMLGIVGMIAALIGAGFFTIIFYKLFKHKGRGMILGNGLAAVFAFCLYFVRPDNALFWVFTLLNQMFFYGGIGMAYGMVGDTVDVGEQRTGVRVDGFIASFVSLMMKAGGAVGPAVLLAIIASQGYTPNVAQSAQVLNTLNLSISVVMGICLLLICVLFLFYDMDAKKHDGVRQDLESRHRKQFNEMNG